MTNILTSSMRSLCAVRWVSMILFLNVGKTKWSQFVCFHMGFDVICTLNHNLYAIPLTWVAFIKHLCSPICDYDLMHYDPKSMRISGQHTSNWASTLNEWMNEWMGVRDECLCSLCIRAEIKMDLTEHIHTLLAKYHIFEYSMNVASFKCLIFINLLLCIRNIHLRNEYRG